ncbi:hypothetical protein [Roseibium sp.]|uniref:hypothetical protein n=1 Tax=Roseibium sp. TaxID=1936156 RepID=UPI003BACDC8C
MKPAIGCVVALARCAGIALRTTPDRVDRFDAMKWVSIYEGWYQAGGAIRLPDPALLSETSNGADQARSRKPALRRPSM